MKNTCVAILLCVCFTGYAQERWQQHGDSLQQELALHTDEDSVRVNILLALVNIYRKHEPDNALDYSRKALQLSGKIGFRSGVAHAYNNLGLIYEWLEKYDDAIKNQLIAIKLKGELNDMHGVGGSQCNIGEVYIDEKEYGKAIEILNEAKRTIEALPGSHDDDEYLANVNMNLGVAYAKQHAVPNADKAFENAYRIFERMGFNIRIAVASLRLAATRLELEKYDDARLFAEKAIVVGNEVNDKKAVEQANGILAKANRHLDK